MERRLKVAYILTRFPHATETFVMREMYWIRQHGVDLYIFSLLRPKGGHPVHGQARELMPAVQYGPFFSRAVVGAQLHFLRRSPGRYIRALAKAVWQTYREPTVLLRAVALFPMSVYFARRMEELGIDHVHAHFVWLQGIAAGVVSDLLGIPFTVNPHAFDLFERDQEDVRKELENASKVITISSYHRDYIARLSPLTAARGIEIVHCGLEADRFQPVARRDGGTPRILSVGRLMEKKGQPYLVEACALLARRGVDFRCDIVGEGGLRQTLRELIDREKLGDRVKLWGALDQDEVLKLLRQADVFALPSVVSSTGDRDGIPVALMEAMACEVPVITTGVAGIPELVVDGESGLVVEERDAVGLAGALEKLLLDPELRRQMGARGRQVVLEGFEVRQNAAKLSSIIREIVGDGPESPIEEPRSTVAA